jgi:hypothetical protein
MASRRALKKSINNLTFELVSECHTFKLFHPEKKHEKTNQTMQNLVQMRNGLINKINNPMEKHDFKKNRKHFNGIVKELNTMVSLMDNIG